MCGEDKSSIKIWRRRTLRAPRSARQASHEQPDLTNGLTPDLHLQLEWIILPTLATTVIASLSIGLPSEPIDPDQINKTFIIDLYKLQEQRLQQPNGCTTSVLYNNKLL